MSEYAKPEVMVNEGISEGVFTASGEKLCRFGYADASPGRDACQSCSKTKGKRGDGKDEDGNQCYKRDFTECIDNMPLKSKEN